MWTRILFGMVLMSGVAQAQSGGQFQLASIREDVRGLVHRLGNLTLRVEQLERENAALKANSASAASSYATVRQLNDAVAELNRSIRAAAADTESAVLKKVAVQMDQLARQTNAAVNSVAKGMAQRPVVRSDFSDDFPKQGVSYTIQKGDTISSIAQKTGSQVKDIINANKISDPTRIQVGQTIFVPVSK